jgi:hypothetical protein
VNPASRREYDHERFAVGPGAGSRAVSLRARNEGGLDLDRPTSVYEAGDGWQGPLRGTPAAGAGAPPNFSSSSSSSSSSADRAGQSGVYTAEDSREVFRASMERANERQRDSAKFRASLQRMQRAQIEVPSQSASFSRLLAPLTVLAIWGVNYMLFFT